MKQRKKSFGMRISAFVLSFAMVCTLLAGVNVVAFAADDLDDTVCVQKFYWNPALGGSGEHIYTVDEDEITYYSGLSDWNNEGEAWDAPLMSSTPVYRLCNYNTGEHIWVADKGYADLLVAQGWTIEQGIAFYSDDNKGIPVYRLWNGTDGVGCHHYTTDEGEIFAMVLAGWQLEDVQFYGVKEESSYVMTAEQTGAKEITLTPVTGEFTGLEEFTVSHGDLVDELADVEFDEEEGTAVITLADPIEDATYTVSCDGFEDATFEGEEINKEMEVTQTGAAELLVTFSEPVAEADSISIYDGIVELDATVVFSEDRTSATVVMDENFEDDEYTVVCTDEEFESVTFDAEAAELTDVVIGDELISQGNDTYAGIMKPIDQWGDDFDVALDRVVIGSVSPAAIKVAGGFVTITQAGLKEGDVLAVSVVEDTFVKTGKMTVSAASVVADIQLSPIQMTPAEALVNTTGRIDVDDLSKVGRYFYVVNAKDQYCYPISGKSLNNMYCK